MRYTSKWLAMALIAAMSSVAFAQDQAKDLEPAVDTSAPPPSALEPAVDTSVAPPPSVLEPAVDTSSEAQTQAPANEAAAPAQNRGAAPNPRTGARSGNAMDRLELDTTQITGNRELPKVLYIVPWKRSDLGDLLGKPVNSLLDEVLTPVDRDVFKRENRYFNALENGNAPAAGNSATPASGNATPPATEGSVSPAR
jgi:hypothetical protein